MAFWDKDKQGIEAEVKSEAEAKPVEKTAAELIAESLSGFEQRITSKFDELGTRVAAVEESTRKPVPQVEPQEVPSVFENETAAINYRIAPVALRQLELEARVVLSEIKGEYAAAGFGDMWTALDGDIRKVLNESPLVGGDGKPVRGNPDYIRNVVDMVFGRAARQKGVKFRGTGSDQTFFLEGANGDAGGANAEPADGLTSKQRRIFERMGIDPKDGAKTRAKLEFVQ